MKPRVIVNPHAASGRAGRTFGGVRAVLERRIGAVDVAFSDHPGDAIRLSHAAALEGCPLVVAVGGDGTFNEVANGVLDAGSETSVGYVGQGTGGDFRRSLSLPHRLDAYAEAIAGPHERRIDVGQLRYRAPDGSTQARWFVNILSAGLGGLVDQEIVHAPKLFGAKAAYFWATLQALARCERGRLRCTVGLDGQDSLRSASAYMIAICNGRYFGGGMHVAPMAKLDDGRFEVVAMDAPSKLAFTGFSRRIYAGTHLTAPGVEQFGCDRIAIDLDNEHARDVFLLDVDGEPLGGLPIEVTVVRRALKVKCGAAGAA
jgi:YegS/Rv2252/BmrU family lipid kinase